MDLLKSCYTKRNKPGDRPTFFIKDSNGKENVIRACGLIVSHLTSNGKTFLFREENKNGKNVLCDMGGKTDVGDKTVIDTLFREVAEETNCNLFGNHTYEKCIEMLNKVFEEASLTLYFIPSSKYLLVELMIDSDSPPFLAKVPRLKMKRFGLVEEAEGVKHYYKWIKNVKYKNLHIRLGRIFKQLFLTG